MITENDVAGHYGLPPEQRFYLTERLVRQRLVDACRAVEGSPHAPTFDEFDYMVEVLAAAEAFGIDELSKWELPRGNDRRSSEECRAFLGEATKVAVRLMLTYAGVPVSEPNTAALDASTKLRFYLGQVRSIIGEHPIAPGT